jgi:hypothetical protein
MTKKKKEGQLEMQIAMDQLARILVGIYLCDQYRQKYGKEPPEGFFDLYTPQEPVAVPTAPKKRPKAAVKKIEGQSKLLKELHKLDPERYPLI